MTCADSGRGPKASAVAGCVLVLGMLIGCGRGERVGVIEGRVTLDGTPLTGVTVMFDSADAGAARMASVDAAGRYTMKTHATAGLPPGRYEISIVPGIVRSPLAGGLPPLQGKPEDRNPKSEERAIPQRYQSARTSGLAVEVREGKNPPADLELTSS